METITIRFVPLVSDTLHILASEYSINVDLLVSIAVKRLIDDVEFVRDLRTGNVKLES